MIYFLYQNRKELGEAIENWRIIDICAKKQCE
jgi:hypothetical protein